jgi:hypothetical protein
LAGYSEGKVMLEVLFNWQGIMHHGEPWQPSQYSAGLWTRWSRFRVRFLAGAGNFSLHHHIQNGSGAHPASYPKDTRGSFPGGKVARAWRWPLTSI